ncbi:fam-l protein [Plasmodium brasilianum]|uniref:Uncharacterized protein n=2 Tax=Plasmodium (Plasmodium) TaxID=418103 RepID=A0A1A8X0P2_PLAMA|nr:fam-l protein [Plasmodium brasilianum]SBS98805.1 hypothetical protein PMALA_065180 [Plasmodium malariae]
MMSKFNGSIIVELKEQIPNNGLNGKKDISNNEGETINRKNNLMEIHQCILEEENKIRKIKHVILKQKIIQSN